MSDKKAKRIIQSNKNFDRRKLIDWIEFRHLRFRWDACTRPGWQLLRALGISDTREGYERLMFQLFPDALTGRVLVRQIKQENGSMGLEWDRPCSQDPGAERAWPVLRASEEPSLTPQDLYEEIEARRRVRQLVKDLPPSREKDMLLRYYGFIDKKETDENSTLEEIGEIYGVSAERVRQCIVRTAWEIAKKLGRFTDTADVASAPSESLAAPM